VAIRSVSEIALFESNQENRCESIRSGSFVLN
jgi:hypothetical protein